MIARTGSGWQYILADLSLILFMVTAAALASSDEAPAAAKPTAATTRQGQPLSPQGEPLALYRAAPGAPPLGQWLRDQSADARQQLTIVAQYPPGSQAEALGQAERLAQQAGEAGALARIVVEPGQGGTTASLAFDSPVARPIDPPLARKLQEPRRKP
jgi:hypothetical protein